MNIIGTIDSETACLLIICKHYGKHFSTSTMSEICRKFDDGASYVIEKAAEHLGLHTIVGHLPVNKLSRVTLPCVLMWKLNHFVVLQEIKGETYYINDPLNGLIKYRKSDLAEHWCCLDREEERMGVAIFIKPTPKFYELEDENDNSDKVGGFIKICFKRLLGKLYT